jgi:hypothetical protein
VFNDFPLVPTNFASAYRLPSRATLDDSAARQWARRATWGTSPNNGPFRSETLPALTVKKTAPDGAHFAVVFLPSKRMRDVGHANNWQNFQSNPCHDKGESLSWAGFEIGYEVAIL